PRALVESLDRAAEAPIPGAARPDDVVVHRIGNRPAAFAAGHRVPQPARNRARDVFVGLFGEPAVARAARRWAVLAVAVNVVWNLVVRRDVIHLRDRQLDVVPAAAATR